MLNLALFTTCLLGALQDYTLVNVTYVLCPGSWNCLCPFNITGLPNTTAAPRCVKLSTIDLFCDRKLLVQEEANFFFEFILFYFLKKQIVISQAKFLF